MVRTIKCLSGMALVASAFAREMAMAENGAAISSEMYESGQVHNSLMQRKMDSWARAQAAGVFEQAQYPELGYTPCVNGFAEAIKGDRNNTFRCQNMDLYHFLNHATLGDDSAEGSSSWGWTSDTGREFVAIGQNRGTAFVEIGSDGKMKYLGRLPAFSVPSIWREIRTYQSYVVIGSEARGHGIQIFDLRKLLDIDPASPREFTQADLTAHTTVLLPVGRAHNVVVNEELGYFAAVGAQPRNDPICRSGLNFFDIKDPSKPISLGCAADDGYVHDAQCLVYRGPDTRYSGRDICYGYNEDTLTIYDVTVKNTTNIISRVTYPGARYIHQGWVLDVNNQEFLVLDDELDELQRSGQAADGFPVTYIYDIRKLDAPVLTGSYKLRHRGIDHNQYVIDGLNYQSSYGAGVRVFDISSIPRDPTGRSVCEAAFMDIYPEDDALPGGGQVEFLGTWSSYAYFKSGYIFVNTIERGAFVTKLTSRSCPPRQRCNEDNCLRAFRNRLPEGQAACATFTQAPRTETTGLPQFAIDRCAGNVVSRVSSACSCLPTPTP